MIRIFFLLPVFLFICAFSTPKYSFPVNSDYPYGIRVHDASGNIQKRYDEWLKEFYTEQDDLARICWDNPSKTVSEGIAYGMLIMVYMDNAINKTQGKFDKLWRYYKKFSNNRGIMHWQVEGFEEANGENGASDAELDAAVALLMAHKQWGREDYLQDAKALIQAIHAHEVNDKGFIKPGDAWDKQKNPSYLSTGALELYKTASDKDWDKVIEKSYDLLKNARNPKTGLVPDWCDESGGNLNTKFSYNAVRTPWRMAWAYAWYGHPDAKENANLVADWIQRDTEGDPSKVTDGYELDGSRSGTGGIIRATFLGAFTCAGMVDVKHKSWLKKWYDVATQPPKDRNYYSETLRLLYVLLVSGNFQNFATFKGAAIPVVQFKKGAQSPSGADTWYGINGRVIRQLQGNRMIRFKRIK